MMRVLPLFFMSGVSGLVYQVIWVREFGTVFGATVSSAATVSAVFMLGLGVGSYLVGRWADRLYARRRTEPLRVYGLFEIVIALLGLMIALVLPHLGEISAALSTYQQNERGWYEFSAASEILRFGVALLLLAPITFLMGGTLTLLIRYLVSSDLSLAGWRTGALYGINTAGAAVGAFMTDFSLVPRLGIFGTELVAVALNAAAGLAALALASAARRDSSAASIRDTPVPGDRISSWRPLLGMSVALFCSGVAAMGMEIVWFRYLISNFGGLRTIFSLLLTTILTGIFLGSLFGGWLERRTGRAGVLYVATQTLFVLSSIATFIYFDPRTMSAVDPNELLRLIGDSDGLSRSLLEAGHYLQPVILTTGIPAILMGCSFPLANAYAQRIASKVGSSSGLLYLSNTAGNVIGSVGTGLLLLPWLGVQFSAILLMGFVAVGLVSLGLSDSSVTRDETPRAVPARVFLSAAALILMALLAWLRQPPDLLLMRTLPANIVEGHLEDANRIRILALDEGINETVAVVQFRGMRSLYTNGHSMSATNVYVQRYMRLFVHLPLLNIEGPRSSLVICFGVGTTLHATSLYSSMETLEVADISRNVLEHADFFSNSNDNVIEDERLRVYVNDGRQHLRMQTEAQYDLVTLEPPPIDFAGVANLYSEEFYELAKSRLREGGYLTQWLPGYQVSERSNLAIVKAFIDVFPGAVLVSGANNELILMGKKGGPPTLDIERMRQSLAAEPAVRADLESVHVHSLTDLVSTFAGSYDTLQRATQFAEPVTDDNPIIEYDGNMGLVRYNRMPIGIFDPREAHTWCPDCYEGDKLREEFRRLEPLQRVLAAYYASDAFLDNTVIARKTLARPASRALKDMIRADPCVAGVLDENVFWRSIFADVLQGVPKKRCE